VGGLAKRETKTFSGGGEKVSSRKAEFESTTQTSAGEKPSYQERGGKKTQEKVESFQNNKREEENQQERKSSQRTGERGGKTKRETDRATH